MIFGSALEAPTGVAGLDDVAVVGQAIEQRFFAAPANSYARRLLDSVRLCLFARGACDAVAETAATATANPPIANSRRRRAGLRRLERGAADANCSSFAYPGNGKPVSPSVVPPPKAKFAPSALKFAAPDRCGGLRPAHALICEFAIFLCRHSEPLLRAPLIFHFG